MTEPMLAGQSVVDWRGMNVEQAEFAARMMKQAAGEYRMTTANLRGALMQASWNGPRARNFMQDWHGLQTRLYNFCHELEAMSSELARAAADQRQVSGG